MRDVPAFDGGGFAQWSSLVVLRLRLSYTFSDLSIYTPSHGYIHLHVDFDESPRAIIHANRTNRGIVVYRTIALGASVRRVRLLSAILYTAV